MKTRAVRMHAALDLRIDEFELPPIKDDEMLVEIVTDSICMSTHKMALLGAAHKRVPENIAEHPVIAGHELAGNIVEVGAKYQKLYKPGQRFTIQPNLMYQGSMASPGYSYEFCGGDATYAILPQEVFATENFLLYEGEGYYKASLAEPLSCSIGATHAAYHTQSGGYAHEMGIRADGKLAIMAGAGPMGLGALSYIIHRDPRPSMVVVSDINKARLARAASFFPPEKVKDETGVDLRFVDTGELDNPVASLRELTGGSGFDDVLCYAPVAAVVEQSGAILGHDGCLNFFAGPTDAQFSAKLNFYDVHYNSTHVMGTSGGNKDDMVEALEMMAKDEIDPAVMVTHIGGLDAVPETVINLPKIAGGKKLIYPHIDMPLVALDDLRLHEKEDERYAGLADIVEANNMLWSPKAERYLLENWT